MSLIFSLNRPNAEVVKSHSRTFRKSSIQTNINKNKKNSQFFCNLFVIEFNLIFLNNKNIYLSLFLTSLKLEFFVFVDFKKILLSVFEFKRILSMLVV